MKKTVFATIAVLVLVTASQVSASNEKANEHSNNSNGSANQDLHVSEQSDKGIVKKEVAEENKKSQDANVEMRIHIKSIDGEDPEECSEDVKNHGEYVSCVAKLHLGGKTVSEAAKSQIGKKHKDVDDDNDENDDNVPSITPTPSISLTPTPSISLTPTPTDVPTATPSVTITPSPTDVPDNNANQAALVAQIKELIKTLKDLIKVFTSTLHI